MQSAGFLNGHLREKYWTLLRSAMDPTLPRLYPGSVALPRVRLARLVRNHRHIRGHKFGEARIFSHLRKLYVLVHIFQILVAGFHGLSQVFERLFRQAHLGVQLCHGVVISCAIFGTGNCSRTPSPEPRTNTTGTKSSACWYAATACSKERFEKYAAPRLLKNDAALLSI